MVFGNFVDGGFNNRCTIIDSLILTLTWVAWHGKFTRLWTTALTNIWNCLSATYSDGWSYGVKVCWPHWSMCTYRGSINVQCLVHLRRGREYEFIFGQIWNLETGEVCVHIGNGRLVQFIGITVQRLDLNSYAQSHGMARALSNKPTRQMDPIWYYENSLPFYLSTTHSLYYIVCSHLLTPQGHH